MPTAVNELITERNRLVTELRSIDDSTAEGKTKFESVFAQAENIKGQIDRRARLAELEREAAAATREIPGGAGGGTRPSAGEQRTIDQLIAERSKEFRSWLGLPTPTSGRYQFRALQMDNPTEGQTLVRPEEFVARLIKAVDDLVFIRGLATKHQLSDSASMGAPSLDTDIDDYNWTGEITEVSEDTAMRLGKRSLTPHALAKLIKVSRDLLRFSALPAEQIVIDRLAYKFALTQEKAFLTGNGAQQPLGVFVASAAGINTDRDISDGNTSTAIGADALLNVKYTLKSQYWANARWLWSREAVKRIAKLKDGEGQYLWQPGLQQGQPDRLVNFPLLVSEHVPATFTSGNYVGILGDFSHYWIADAIEFELQRLVELYAKTNQVGFIARGKVDGMPVQPEAFVRVKLA